MLDRVLHDGFMKKPALRTNLQIVQDIRIRPPTGQGNAPRFRDEAETCDLFTETEEAAA